MSINNKTLWIDRIHEIFNGFHQFQSNDRYIGMKSIMIMVGMMIEMLKLSFICHLNGECDRILSLYSCILLFSNAGQRPILWKWAHFRAPPSVSVYNFTLPTI